MSSTIETRLGGKPGPRFGVQAQDLELDVVFRNQNNLGFRINVVYS